MSFLSKVFGGGNIFGSLLSVASMFFPPLAIAGSLSNLLTSAIGEAVKMAASALVKELGMPKFIEAIIGKVVDQVLPQLLNKQTDPQADEATSQHFTPQVRDFRDDLANKMVQIVRETRESQNENSAAGSKNKASTAGKSWYVQLAIALGQALNNQADKVQKLAEEVNATFDAKADAQAKVDSKTGKGMDAVTRAEGKAFDKMQEFQAETQVMNMLSQTVNNAVSSLGQALSNAARKG